VAQAHAVGTTDTPIATPTLEPRPLPEEIEFILETAGQYLLKPPTRDDVLSVFVGIRPLVKSGDGILTAALSRDHTIHFDASGLLTTTGGKWTTYRNMAEHAVDQAADFARLAERPCVTRSLNVHGFHSNADRFGALSMYGSDALAIQDLMRVTPSLSEPLISSCRIPAPKSSGLPVMRWHAPSKTCSRAARARCSSTRVPRGDGTRRRPADGR
jgi:glycerol-3-phosphate dehydrogenase